MRRLSVVLVLSACSFDASGLGGVDRGVERNGRPGRVEHDDVVHDERRCDFVRLVRLDDWPGEALTTSTTSAATDSESTTGASSAGTESGGNTCEVDPPGTAGASTVAPVATPRRS
jgi:hypothetical protein